MAIPKPITRVEQYLAHISGMRVNVPEAPLTREERYLAAWAKKSGIEDAEIQGDPPLTLKDCIGEPFKGLTLYGKSTQVTTTGAQLFVSKKSQESNVGVTLTQKDDGGWHLEGTNTADDPRNIRLLEPTEYFTLPSGNYTLSFTGDIPNSVTLNIAKVANVQKKDEQWTFLGSVNKNKKDLAISLDGTEEALSMYVIFPAQVALSFDFYVMLNAGDTALPWEPYTGGKPSPSPDYPQEIQSAKSEVVVHGKNLFGGRFYYANYSMDVLKIDGNKKENEVELPFVPTYESFGVCKVIKCQKGKTYVISVANPNKNATIGMAEYENIEKALNIDNALGFTRMNDKILEKSYIAKSDGILVCGIAGTWTDGKTTLHECTESELLQVEEASEATSYEPYHELQSMSVTTPNGLPGIPVSSGGNYTDEIGQQWICDEVDFAGGVYRQRIKHVNVVFKKGASSSTHSGYRHMAGDIKNMSREYTECMCNIATYSRYTANGTEGIRASGAYNALVLYYENLTNDNVPADVAYILSDSIETQLSEADLAAYRALTTYRGTTILESECGLKVIYSKLRK